jgi:hypothetical protein
MPSVFRVSTSGSAQRSLSCGKSCPRHDPDDVARRRSARSARCGRCARSAVTADRLGAASSGSAFHARIFFSAGAPRVVLEQLGRRHVDSARSRRRVVRRAPPASARAGRPGGPASSASNEASESCFCATSTPASGPSSIAREPRRQLVEPVGLPTLAVALDLERERRAPRWYSVSSARTSKGSRLDQLVAAGWEQLHPRPGQVAAERVAQERGVGDLARGAAHRGSATHRSRCAAARRRGCARATREGDDRRVTALPCAQASHAPDRRAPRGSGSGRAAPGRAA